MEKFFIDALGYTREDEFDIPFDDEGKDVARCIALRPPEREHGLVYGEFWRVTIQGTECHIPPEIFISEGSPGSIVANWVASRGGVGGIHHMAYEVRNVEKTKKEWEEKGFAKFSSEPITCPSGEMTQVFTIGDNPLGTVIELISRNIKEAKGFCKDSVKALMISSKHD